MGESMKKSAWALIALLILVLLIFTASLFRGYRDIEAMEERIENNWTRVDRALQVRNDLIPDLINTAKGYAPGERDVFEGVVRARVGMSEARDIDELSKASVAMKNALTDLLSVAESCPPLKDDRDFDRLRDELAETENRIAVECRIYNESVREYNACLEPFPNNILAGIFGFVRNDSSFGASNESNGLLALDKGGNV
jgi:LemA protein